MDAVYCSGACGQRHRQQRHYDKHPDAFWAKRAALNADAPKRMWARAKSRASRSGVPFDLDVTDIIIPDTCPVLGIPIYPHSGSRGMKDNSPSLDRIDPSLGYTRGNVRVISGRANLLKSNTSVAELRAVLADLENLRNC